MTKPVPRQHSASPEYLPPAALNPTPNENVTRIFYFANTPAILDFAEVAALIETLADFQGVYPYYSLRALGVRGTSDQLALTEWLFNELDQPAHPNPSHKSDVYNYQGADGENAVAVRVFYLPHIQAVQEFDRIAANVGGEEKIRRFFTFSSQRAIAVRGTTDEIAATERLLAEADPADFPSP